MTKREDLIKDLRGELWALHPVVRKVLDMAEQMPESKFISIALKQGSIEIDLEDQAPHHLLWRMN